MKKIIFTLFFILINISLYSQVLTFFGGVKQFDNNSKNLLLYYYDQSTEPNSIYKNITINHKELYTAGVTIGFVDLTTKLYFDLGLQAYFQKHNLSGGDFGLEIGYVHPYFLNKRIAVFPTVGVGYGFYDLDFGEMINKSGSIQINSTTFNAKSLSVYVRKDYISLRPSLNIYCELSKKVSLQLTGSYLHTFDFKDGISFLSSEYKKMESVYLTSNNVTFQVDGVKSNELPYSLRGFEVRLGVGFILGSSAREKTIKKEKEKPVVENKSKPDSSKININKIETDTYTKNLSDAQNAYNDEKYLLVLELLKDFPSDNEKYNEAVALMNKAIAKLSGNTNQNFVTVSGSINCNCSKIINGYVVFEDMNTRMNVGKCRITSDGYYCIILPSGKIYSYYIDAKDFYPISRVVDFTTSKQNLNHKDNIVLVSYEEMKEKQLSVRINNIFFDFNKSELKPESYLELDRLFNFLKDNSDIKVEISGHTDNVGTDEYNMNLSQARANTVKDYLVEKGIESIRIISKGYGESKPVSTNDTEEGRQLNRRVEFKIIK
jgi:outer membrane protein OmpA-like peptidoglycan-associated protein